MSVKNFRERSPILIGILSILGITAGTTFAFSIDKIPAIKQAYEIKGEFADAAGLNSENQVRVAGVKVGTVAEIVLEGDKVVVTMEIDNGIEVSEDALAEIKLATILGTKFVELQGDGEAPFLEEGDVITLDRTAVPYEIYQASNQGTTVLEGLNGPRLNRMLEELTTLLDVSQDELGAALEGLNQLGGSLNANQEHLRGLLAGSDDLTAALDEAAPDINRLVDASNTVLESLASKREDIQSLLEVTKVMAGDLTDLLRDNRANLDGILNKLHNALLVLERNVDNLDMALEYAGPSSRYLANVFTQGRWGDIYTCALVLSAACEVDE